VLFPIDQQAPKESVFERDYLGSVLHMVENNENVKHEKEFDRIFVALLYRLVLGC
jgi:hypothetical protein